jgi:hypothetical protein
MFDFSCVSNFHRVQELPVPDTAVPLGAELALALATINARADFNQFGRKRTSDVNVLLSRETILIG